MSVIKNGQFIRSDVAKYANGGTEYMAETIVKNINFEVLNGVDIWVSRVDVNSFDYDQKNVLYVHDMGGDPMYDNINLHAFDRIVFVSAFQMASFANKRVIPYEKCLVIPNCTSMPLEFNEKNLAIDDEIKFIYHTTPHRGLEELVDNFEIVRRTFKNAKLHVFSSFDLYGWKDRDLQYRDLFSRIKKDPNMVYRGYKPREELYKIIPTFDVFWYPCKWPETSCISLIEAAKSGLLCLVPDYSALGETAKYPNVQIYDPAIGVERLMSAVEKNVFVDGRWNNRQEIFPYHEEEVFTSLWERMLWSLKDG